MAKKASAKGNRTKAAKKAVRTLKPSRVDTVKGGATRFDPYKNFKF